MSEAIVNPNELTIEQVQDILRAERYICDRSLATVVYLSLVMGKPLLLEGEAGVGKTEIAKVLSKVLDAKLIRLQCYEGLDANTALYEWNYPKQMLRIKLEEVEHGDKETVETEIFTQDYLIKRPLLEAIQTDGASPPVLLIDEIDRADMEFEAFLLEVLSDFQITIPEIGTIAAKHRPYVFLTSNRTREIHDALKRRCLYHWVDYPSAERELAIVKSRVPGISAKLSQQVVRFVQALRDQDFYKSPGVAETIDWATALTELDARSLTPQLVGDTLGALLKYQDDIARMQGDTLQKVLKEATSDN
jgi:MoxR-like ATPase